MGKKVKKNKLKSNRGAMKRFKLTGSGKVRFKRAYRNHINTKKSTKVTRHQRPAGVLKECDAKLARRMMLAE